MYRSDKDLDDFLIMLKKYEAGTASPEESRFVEKYMDYLDKKPNQTGQLSEQEKSDLHLEIKQRLQQLIHPSAQTPVIAIRSTARRMKWWVAAVFLLLAAGTVTWLNRSATPEIIQVNSPGTTKQVAFVRTITLPDGSTVVLQAGSKLDYSSISAGNTREVTLTGEAYFDIVHNPGKPFIIHTGKVKTTVIGTAFNIKAWPEQKNVVVSVTRGKVRVEDGHKILAVLIPNRQVTYHLPDATYREEPVNATTVVTNWTKKDMVFKDETFESVTKILSRRYGVHFEFKNTQLKNCGIVASFEGVETLQNVMHTLETILNLTYTINGNTVIVDGIGCD